MFWMPIVFAYVTLHTDGPGGTGPELKWRQAEVPFAYNATGSDDLSSGTEFTVIENSFQAWNDACPVNYTSHGFTAKTAADDFTNGVPVDGNEKTDGASTINWIESGWPYPSGIIGITFTWFASDGTIGEADMLLNGQDYSWTDGDTGVLTDEGSIVTHEAGHYLGMAHSPNDTEATMFATVNQGETKKRTLDADDIAGAKHLYPNAFGDQTPRACGCRLDGESPSRGLLAGALSMLLLGAIAFAARRSRRAGARLAAAAVLALGLGLASSARATVMLDLPLDQLTAQSDTVVLGTVEKVETVTDGQTIHTDQTIVVTRTIAGLDAGTEITVRTPGGLLPAGVAGPNGFAGMIADGVPRFAKGEELVLFLRKLPAGGAFAVTGFEQGKLAVVRDGKTGEGRLYRDLSGSMRVVKTPEGGLEAAPPEDALAGMTLEDLAARLAVLPIGTAR